MPSLQEHSVSWVDTYPGFQNALKIIWVGSVCRKEKQQELIANCYRKRFNGNIILGAAIDNEWMVAHVVSAKRSPG